MWMAAHYENKVRGQSGSMVPRFPGSGILVPCRHSQIFGAAQVWLGMSQTLVPGAFLWAAGVAGMAGAWFIWVAGVAGAAGVGCIHCAGGVVQVVLLRSIVEAEPAVWQLCHLGQCQLLWHCIHKGVSMCSGMWNHFADVYLIAVLW